jgi:ADP-heptose:LPS heptosyltransferase
VKILVIRLSSIGDIVLTSPVVRCIKQQLPNTEIHFVTKRQYSSIVQSNPNVDKVHIFDENLNELISILGEEKFNYIIDLHNNYRSSRIKHSLKIPTFSVNKLNLKKLLLVWLKINQMPQKHMVDRNLETVLTLGVKNDNKGLDFFIPENEEFKTNDLPFPFQKGYVAFVIAATWATKKLPIEKITAICNNTPFPVILLGGKGEFDEGEIIVSQSKGNVLNFAGKINLNQSASLVRDANVVLTNDTGLMHIAAAFKKKILVFWGNTVPDFGMVPYQPHQASLNLEVEGLKCRPCSKLGYQKCPKKHFRCMNEMDVLKAINWIESNFQKQKAGIN